MKIGAEFEYWTIDEKGRLCSCEELAGGLEFAEQEFVKPLFEIQTDPHDNVEEIKEQTRHRLQESIEAAESLGLQLVPLGTPLNSGDIEVVDSPRGQIQDRVVGEQMKYARRVAGTHFHFEQMTPVRQLNTLTALDPALALTTSSRFCMGSEIGENARNQVYRYRCYREFPRHGQLWSYAENLEEWRQRREERYREFRQRALDKGVDPGKFDEHFNPSDTIWTPVRLRDSFGTVEWRSPDSTMTSRLMQILDQVKNVMEEQPELPGFDRVNEISEKAIQKGLRSEKVRSYLEEFGFETGDFPRPQQGYSRDSIPRTRARKFRKGAAKKLREDLEQL